MNPDTKPRVNLADAVQDLAPAKPPCYETRTMWLEYLKSAAAAQNHRGEPKVIQIVNGDPVFNRRYPFCIDCTAQKSGEMAAKGLCQPDYLVNNLAKTAHEDPARPH